MFTPPSAVAHSPPDEEAALEQERPYSVKAVTVLARGTDVLVREFVFAPGEGTPWHRHEAVRDLCVCVLGEIVLETRAPEGRVTMGPGERAETPAGQVHRLVNTGLEDCRLILIQAGGAYDFQVVDLP